MKSKWITLRFSGGKDSTALTLRMIELGEHIDEVICCDTYKEFPAMYRHIEKIRKIVEENGIKFTLLQNEYSFDYLMFEKPVNSKRGQILRGYSWPSSRSRWCTSKLKLDVINRYLRELRKTHDVVEVLGIAADEAYRANRKTNQADYKRYPLIEWGWNEKDCLRYCYERGFNWEGLYDIFNRVSCWCCPLQPLGELRKLRKYFPELWEKLKDMDKRTGWQFRANYSVELLDRRFAFEEERTAAGLSITNKDFHTKLKERLLEIGEE